jgi:hypothetical protein
MFDHHRRYRRDLDHLMAQRRWIFSLQQHAAAAAGIRMVLHHFVNALHRQQLRASAGMARLAAPLAATAFATLGRLKPRTIAGGRFGGIAGAAADPLPQVGQFGSQSGELGTQLLDLLLLSQEQRTNSNWCRQPVRF